MINPEKRLEDIFNTNANKGLAIAITGQWGVGKTYFWQKAIEKLTIEEIQKVNSFYYQASKLEIDKIFDKKYAYVSLFGVETLSDLKTMLYSQLRNSPIDSEKSTFKNIRNSLIALKDTRITQYGINASTKLFEIYLFSQVKDAIICFDDFERMSDKMNIKDVMGLANFLRQERNCQVVLILDESKTNEENKNSYAEYKEKLVDETIKITTVKPLLREKAKDLDQELIELLINFSNDLDIHNFRFFQKVIKLYRQFLQKLPVEVSYLTKETILIQILKGYFIEDFRQTYLLDWEDCRFMIESERENWSSVKQQSYNLISKKVPALFYDDSRWTNHFQKWFTQSLIYDNSKISDLATSDLISERKLRVREEINILMHQWRNIEMKQDFCERLFQCAIESIGAENLDNLNFYRILLKTFARADLAKQLRTHIKHWIDQSINEQGKAFAHETFQFGFKPKNLFYRYIRIKASINPHLGLPPLIDVIDSYVLRDGWNSETDGLVLEKATLNDWYKLLFEEIDQDERFNNTNKLLIIRKILKQQIKPELNPQLKELIYQALDLKAQESEIMQLNINYIKQRLEEDS